MRYMKTWKQEFMLSFNYYTFKIFYFLHDLNYYILGSLVTTCKDG